jgi:hypothetical protein
VAVARRFWRYSFRYPGKEQIGILLLILAAAILSNVLIGHLTQLLGWLRKTLLGVHGY